MHRNDQFIKSAYSDISYEQKSDKNNKGKGVGKEFLALAASVLIIISGVFGWFMHDYNAQQMESSITNIAEWDNKKIKHDKILVHISVMDEQRVETALAKIETLMANSDNKNLEIEIVANASGLTMLKEDSPYANRLTSLTNSYANVSIKACNFAKQAIELKEGKEMILLPNVEKVPAALEEILILLDGGWLYIKA